MIRILLRKTKKKNITEMKTGLVKIKCLTLRMSEKGSRLTLSKSWMMLSVAFGEQG